MNRIVLAVFVLALSVAPLAAQWLPSTELPSDSAEEGSPAVVAVSDSNLFAVWLSTYVASQERQVRASTYEADSGYWKTPVALTGRSSEVSTTGPTLTVDPVSGGLWAAFYLGSFPVDYPWGIYTVRISTTGIDTPRLAMPDTGVGNVLLRYNGNVRVGMAWTDVSGSGMDMYSSVWYSQMDSDTWVRRQLVAQGTGTPSVIDCTEPALCRDTGDHFFLAWSRVVQSPPSSEVHITRVPDTATIGVFPGSAPANVYDMNGTLLASNMVTDGSNHHLLTRFYRNGTWSDPETLTSDESPDIRHRVALDPEGLFWIIYCEGGIPPYRILARHYSGDRWSAPETVGTGNYEADPTIVSTYSGNLWAVWRGAGTGGARIFVSRRNGRPGLAEQRQVAVQPLRVVPTISRSGFTVAAGNAGPVTVYNATGQAVAALRTGETGRLRWNGTNSAGSRVPPGVYAIRAGTGRAQKVVVR